MDLFFEVCSVISPLPTEKKLSVAANVKIAFSGNLQYLKIAGTDGISDNRFGVCAKSWVYTNFLVIPVLFLVKVIREYNVTQVKINEIASSLRQQ